MNLSYDLEAVQLVMSPMRLETLSGGSVNQQSWLGQANFNNQAGGDYP